MRVTARIPSTVSAPVTYDRELCRRLREGERITKGGGGVGGGRIAKEGRQNGRLRKLVQWTTVNT